MASGLSGGALTRPARLEQLPELLEFAEAACRKAGGGDDACHDVRLALEEILTNVIVHGYRGLGGELTLAWEVAPGRVELSVADRAPLFDPAQAPVPDLAAGLAQRPIGGLGWHLVRRTMDELRHQARAGGGNQVTVVKRV